MGAYAIVLAPLAAILASDYFLVKKQRYSVPMLYDPNGIYRYNRFGTNWRALVALIVAIAPNMPGMINALDSSISIGGAKYVYAVSSSACPPPLARTRSLTFSSLRSLWQYASSSLLHAVLPLTSPLAVVVGGGVHWLLSALFPDHDSLINEAIYAQDVLDGKVEGYSAPMANNTKAERGSAADESSVEEKEAAQGNVV